MAFKGETGPPSAPPQKLATKSAHHCAWARDRIAALREVFQYILFFIYSCFLEAYTRRSDDGTTTVLYRSVHILRIFWIYLLFIYQFFNRSCLDIDSKSYIASVHIYMSSSPLSISVSIIHLYIYIYIYKHILWIITYFYIRLYAFDIPNRKTADL